MHDICWKIDTPQYLKTKLMEIEGEIPETLDEWKSIFVRAGLKNIKAIDKSYIITEDIGGAMFWEFSSDKFSNLLNVVDYVFNQESSDNIIGDFNNDETINILDVVILVEHILSPAAVELDGADINNDGNVNVIDVVLLVEIILN